MYVNAALTNAMLMLMGLVFQLACDHKSIIACLYMKWPSRVHGIFQESACSHRLEQSMATVYYMLLSKEVRLPGLPHYPSSDPEPGPQ